MGAIVALGVWSPVQAQDPCVVQDDGSGTITLPPEGCQYLSPDEVHAILDGLPAGTTIEFAPIHKDFICNRNPDGFPGCPPPGFCEDVGGSLGGDVDCFESAVELHMTGTGDAAGFDRALSIPILVQVHTGPRNPGDAVQDFDSDMVYIQGGIFGDPDFDSLEITGGTGFGLPSPGHTTLTRLGPPGSDFQVDSFFDITYRIDFQGAPGGALGPVSGSTTATIRMEATAHPPDRFADCGDATASSQVTFGSPDLPAIPGGFFGSGSDPFTGTISLQGDPISPSTGDVSTTLRRPSDPVGPADPVGTLGTVPIEIVALSLTSSAPITVTGATTTEWHVEVRLSPGPQTAGSVNAQKSHPNGGLFNGLLPIQPLFRFTNVADPTDVRELDPRLDSNPDLVLEVSGSFVHAVDPSLGLLVDPGTLFYMGVDGAGGTQIPQTLPATTLDGTTVIHIICPPPQPSFCKLPNGSNDLCASLYDVQCLGLPTDDCLAKQVQVQPTPPGGVAAVLCECSTPGPVPICGPIRVGVDAIGVATLYCDGQCITPDAPPCQIWIQTAVGATPTGQTSAPVDQFPVDTILFCDCEPECLTDADCNDNDPCTMDVCLPDGTCQNTPDCMSDADCDDGNICTTDACDPTTHCCVSTPDCVTAADCDDGDTCTIDSCQANCCVHDPDPACEPCDVNADQTACVGVCPEATEVCNAHCVTYDPLTGAVMVTDCQCNPADTCHAEFAPIGGVAAGGVGDPCVVTDVGGTVVLPPVGCDYLSADEVHEIIDGLPIGTTMVLEPIHGQLFCGPGVDHRFPGCPPVGECEDDGGTFVGGKVDCFVSNLALDVTGFGPPLGGFSRSLSIAVDAQVHTAPRNAGDAVQDFDTEMHFLQGEIFGDPDFCTLRVTAGAGFGLPSPGHTTLTDRGDGTFNVDSFFDITYRIEFAGCPGSILDGMAGTTERTIRMQTGSKPTCVGGCPTGQACVETETDNADGTINLCCDCIAEPTGACCLSDGTCIVTTANGCAAAGGTYAGDGTDCTDADLNGFADVCEPDVCEPTADGAACAGPCADGVDACQAHCVIYDALTGAVTVTDCQCDQQDTCHVEFAPAGGVAAGGVGTPCVVAENPVGTVTLPPVGCDYLSPEDVHEIIDGLPIGTTITMEPIHGQLFCGPGIDIPMPDCPLFGDCEEDGGTFIGGKVDCFGSNLALDVTGFGPPLVGFSRSLNVQVWGQVHTAPRTPGDAVQTFDTEMVYLQGELFGDPDFCTFRVTGGTGNGLPSPGQTTLTDLGNGTFNVDSFFDISYRIEFVGCPGSILDGMAGTTERTIRMQTGSKPTCVGGCPVGLECVETETTNADGTINLCCDCQDACKPNADRTGCEPTVCADTNAICRPTVIDLVGNCASDPAIPCTDDTQCPAGVCVTHEEVAECDCVPDDPPPSCRWENIGGALVCSGDCDDGTLCRASVSATGGFLCGCEDPAECQPTADGTACESFICPGTLPPTDTCQPRCVDYDAGTGQVTITDCDCASADTCHVEAGAVGGVAAVQAIGGPCVVANTGGTVTLPPVGCDYLSPEEVHEIVSGLPTVPPTTIELAPIHVDFACGQGVDKVPLCSAPLAFACEMAGGTYGGNVDCFFSELDLTVSGTGSLAGFNRHLHLQGTQVEVHTGPRTPGDAVQDFDTDMFRLQGELFGDPDFCTFRVTGGTDFGLPSPGHTTLTRTGGPGTSFVVDSFFDVTYRIEFEGCPGSVLDGMAGTTTRTIRMQTGSKPTCVGGCPAPLVCEESESVNPDGTIHLCCNCVERTGACCLHDATCIVTTGTDCEAQGGSFAGDGTNCDDTNFDGVADVCEPDVCEPNAEGTGCEGPCPGGDCFGECINGSYCDDPDCCLVPGSCQCYAPWAKESIKRCGDCFGECINGAYCDNWWDDGCCIVSGACACYAANSDISIQLCPDNTCFGECVMGSYCDGSDPNCWIDPAGAQCYLPDHPISRKLCTPDVTSPEVCQPSCVTVNPLTGATTVTACDCTGNAGCHVALPDTTGTVPGAQGAGGVAAAGGDPCVVPDDAGGTVTLPPAGCEYLSGDEVHAIIDAAGPGVTFELAPIHKSFVCNRSDGFPGCPPPGFCEGPGGDYGGNVDCFDSTLELRVTSPDLPGFDRTLSIGAAPVQVHTGPRTSGDAVQEFDTKMQYLQGELFGDPDFCVLRVTAGDGFGLPSPGHTTLTRLPSGDFAVDSFFDITYRIEFQGCPGSQLAGMAGDATGMIHMETGTTPTCEGVCGPNEECRREKTVNADGTMQICCECISTCFASTPVEQELALGVMDTLVPAVKNRSLSIIAGDAGRSQAIRVTLGGSLVKASATLPPPFDVWETFTMWAGPPVQYNELPGKGNECVDIPGHPDACPMATFWASELQCSPYYTDWTAFAAGDPNWDGHLHLHGEPIVPSLLAGTAGPIATPALYNVQVIDSICDPADEASYSADSIMRTSGWGDLVELVGGTFRVPPNTAGAGVTVSDTVAMLQKFAGLPGNGGLPPKSWMDLLGVTTSQVPRLDRIIDVNDLTSVLDAFTGAGYPFGPPTATPCP